MGPSSEMTGVLKNREKVDPDVHRGSRPWRPEFCCHTYGPADTLISDFRPPDRETVNFCCFKPPSVVLCYRSSGKLIQVSSTVSRASLYPHNTPERVVGPHRIHAKAAGGAGTHGDHTAQQEQSRDQSAVTAATSEVLFTIT